MNAKEALEWATYFRQAYPGRRVVVDIETDMFSGECLLCVKWTGHVEGAEVSVDVRLREHQEVELLIENLTHLIEAHDRRMEGQAKSREGIYGPEYYHADTTGEQGSLPGGVEGDTRTDTGEGGKQVRGWGPLPLPRVPRRKW